MRTRTGRLGMMLGALVVVAVSAGSCQCDPALMAAQGLVISPPALHFGYVIVGQSLTKPLHISNGGSVAVPITGASVSGDQDFSVKLSGAPAIQPGQTLTLKVTFAPAALGARRGTLVLEAGPATAPRIEVKLTGTGVTTGPTDGGTVPDGGTVADGGTPPNHVGCADGTREGFVDQARYPTIAGCSGAWSVPGLGMTAKGIQPACNREGGNDSAHADGQGCSALDLCAPGWHICQGLAEVKAKAGSCADAVPPGTPGPGLFFAVAQHSCTNTVCDSAGATCSIQGVANGVADNDNDVFGCSGPSGTNAHLGGGLGSGSSCAPLNSVFACEQPDSLCWNQAMPKVGPWQAEGSNSYDESDYVTKDGCQNDGCSYSGTPIGPSDEGGVLCCAGP